MQTKGVGEGQKAMKEETQDLRTVGKKSDD